MVLDCRLTCPERGIVSRASSRKRARVTVNRPTFRECFSSLWKLRDKGGREHPTARARCSGTVSMTCPFARFEDYHGARQFPSMGDAAWIRAKTSRVQRISWESAPDWRAISEHYDIAIPTPGIPTVVSMRSDVSNGWRAKGIGIAPAPVVLN